MENINKNNLLPEKVVRRHAEMLGEILPDFTKLVIDEGRPADSILHAYLRIHKEMGSRDRRFLSQAIFSYFRWYGWSVNKLDLSVSAACLLGVALDVTELPQSFKFVGSKCKLPFKFPVLGDKTVEEKRIALNELFKDTKNFQPLELADLVSPDFAAVVDPNAVERSIVEFQKRPPAWMRSRTDPAILLKELAEHNVTSKVQGNMPAAIAVEGGVSLNNVLAKHNSQFVVQDIASQCVALACDPKKGDDWWDCCCGAGGKTLHLMDLMKQDGKVLASDIRIPTLKELKRRARHYGVKNIRTQMFNAVNDEPFTKVFDGVLVDAPCSGWGTWSRNPDARWRASKRDVIQCSTRQTKILNNAKWCVKPGGTLVYAVCTFTRPETEEVVMNFLDQHPNFKLAPFINPLTGEETNGQIQIWPWDGSGDAMFIARFVRDAE
ncbi:MAG: RsmB/NOP family class I SAM-dependent RNA methyltransferase [Pontiella sp.]